MLMKKVVGFLLLICLCFLSISCNRQLGELEEQQTYPELVLKDATYAFGRSGDHPISFTASEVVVFSDYTELKNVSFDSPEAFLSGNCDYVKVTDNNSFAQMQGNVKLIKSDDNVIIACEQLDWNNDEGSISCKDEVELTYGNGTYIRALGFSGKTKSNGYFFDKILEGRYTSEE